MSDRMEKKKMIEFFFFKHTVSKETKFGWIAIYADSIVILGMF